MMKQIDHSTVGLELPKHFTLEMTRWLSIVELFGPGIEYEDKSAALILTFTTGREDVYIGDSAMYIYAFLLTCSRELPVDSRDTDGAIAFRETYRDGRSFDLSFRTIP